MVELFQPPQVFPGDHKGSVSKGGGFGGAVAPILGIDDSWSGCFYGSCQPV